MLKTSRGAQLGFVCGAILVLMACAPTRPAASPAQPAPARDAASAPAAKADSDEKAVADFYRGKTIRIVVGYPPGGGFDLYARLLARHMGRYIPGSPTIIVENMPGAAGMVALNQVYNVAPKDGTVIVTVTGSHVFQQLFGASGVQFDMGKMQYLGAPSFDNFVMFVTKATGVTKMEDILGPSGKQVALGGVAPGALNTDAITLTKDVLSANIRLVSGYDGTAKIKLAIEGGELDGMVNSWETMIATDLRPKVDSGEYVVLARYTEQPLKDLPNVPGILTFARNDEQRQLLRIGTIVAARFLRPFMVAPEVPRDRARALEAAYAKTMADKSYQEEAEKGKLDVSPMRGEELQKLFEETLKMPASVKTKLQQVMQPGG